MNEQDKKALAELISGEPSSSVSAETEKPSSPQEQIVTLLGKIERNTAALSLLRRRTTNVPQERRQQAAATQQQERSSRERKPPLPTTQTATPVKTTRATATNTPSLEAKGATAKAQTGIVRRTQENISPAVVAAETAAAKRDNSGRYVSAGTKERAAQKEKAERKGFFANFFGGLKDKISSAMGKDGEKSQAKDAAGLAIGGPIYEAGKELLEVSGEFRDNLKDEQGLAKRSARWFAKKSQEDTRTGRIFKKFGTLLASKKDPTSEAIEETEQAEKKRHRELIQEVRADSANSGGGSGGGLLDSLADLAILKGGKGGGLLSKGLGKAKGLLGKGGGGLGLMKGIGGKLPLIGGLVTAGATLASGGSKTEAAGAGIGGVVGGIAGAAGGPLGAVAGSIAGAWIGEKLGGLFNYRDKAEKENHDKSKELVDAQGTQQEGFWAKLSGSGSPFLAGMGDMADGVKNSFSAAGAAFSKVRQGGGGYIESAAAALKGGYKASKGDALKRETALEQAAIASGMTDPKELAMFMGQAKHETAGFNTMTEYASGAAYEGRADLGNTQAGDGKRFKGRGYFQLTGRANYADMSKKVGADLVNNPELAEDPAIAAKIALQYWKDKKLDQASKAGDFDKVTKKINGGTNGYADRLTQTQAYNAKYADGVPVAGGGPASTNATPGATAKSSAATATSSTPPKVKQSVASVAQAKPEPVNSYTPSPVGAQAGPPPVVKVQGLDSLVAAMQPEKKQASAADIEQPAIAINTEFSDTLLTLIAYDRV